MYFCVTRRKAYLHTIVIVALSEPHWSSQFSTIMPVEPYQFHLSPIDDQNFGHAAGSGGLAPFGKGIHHFCPRQK